MALGYAGQPQGNLATEFYLAITGKEVYALTAPSNVVVVGHSLGGGLAGLVSMLSGVEGHGYDHMPFAAGAINEAFDLYKKNKNGFDAGFLDLINKWGGINPEEAQLLQEAVGRLQELAEANDNLDVCHIEPFLKNGGIRRAA